MITIYSKDNCVKCKMTKKQFDTHSIPYKEINIEHDPNKSFEDHIDYLKNTLGFKTMPIVVTDTDKWSDFRPDKIKTTINQIKES